MGEMQTQKPITLDHILKEHIGEFGRYQKIQFFLLYLPNVIVAWQAFAWTFTGYAPPHRCRLRDELPYSGFKLTSFSSFPSNNETTNQFQCRRPVVSIKAMQNTSSLYDMGMEPCNDGYIWALSQGSNSAVSRWSLVCGQRWVQAVQMSCYFFGQFFGGLFYGFIGDRYGRKLCFISAVLVQLICGIASAYVPIWQLYAALRFLLGSCHPGVLYSSILICMEMVGPSRRMLSMVVASVMWSIGQAILVGLAYAIRDYQQLQLAISLPGILFLLYGFFMPESLRWLVANNRLRDADHLLQTMAKWNKTTVPTNWYPPKVIPTNAISSSTSPTQLNHNFGIPKSPILRMRILIGWLCFFSGGLVYYGIAVNPSFAGGDRYTMFLCSALIEVVGAVLLGLLVNRTGRKPVCILSFAVAGSILILSSFIPSTFITAKLCCIIVAKCSILMAFVGTVLYFPEMFPTSIRASVIGSCSALARCGSICASYATVLLAQQSSALVIIFGLLAMFAALALVPVPETVGQCLPKSVEAAEQQSRGRKCVWRWSLFFCKQKQQQLKCNNHSETAVTDV